jgi:SAM-dependent methyltransferase
MDAAYAALGRTSEDFWRRRMSNHTSQLQRPASDDDLLLECAQALLGPQTTVLDVGAGAGRYAIPFARRAASLTAVEPDATMARLLGTAVEQAGLTNVGIVQSTWQNAGVEPADLVVCAHVLYPIADIVPFIEKLNTSAKVAVFVSLRAMTPETAPLGQLWQRFHGDTRLLQPGYAEIFDVLYEIGIHANLRVRSGPGQTWSYENLDQAVDAVREHIIVPATPANDAVIRVALESALIHDEGVWRLPAPPTYLAVLWWEQVERPAR